MQIIESVKIKVDQSIELKESILNLFPNLHLTATKSQYELWRIGGDKSNLIMYKSGKLVLQTSSDNSKLINIVKGSNSSDHSGNYIGKIEKPFVSRIGADEVGKGDYFGPMVVAAAFVEEKDIQYLKECGVGDSKKINDQIILKIFEQIKDKILYEVKVITPKIYNDLYPDLNNVAILLSKLHGKNIEKLLEKVQENGYKCELVVVDQFSSNKRRLLDELGPLTRKIEFQQFHKGESDISVATASVIARASFLIAWDLMEKEWVFRFPKGATNVIVAGKDFVKKFGRDKLDQVAKVSFKTTGQVDG